MTLIPAMQGHQSVLWSTVETAEIFKVTCIVLLSMLTVVSLAEVWEKNYDMQIVHVGILHLFFHFCLDTSRVISTGKVEWNLAV